MQEEFSFHQEIAQCHAFKMTIEVMENSGNALIPGLFSDPNIIDNIKSWIGKNFHHVKEMWIAVQNTFSITDECVENFFFIKYIDVETGH